MKKFIIENFIINEPNCIFDYNDEKEEITFVSLTGNSLDEGIFSMKGWFAKELLDISKKKKNIADLESFLNSHYKENSDQVEKIFSIFNQFFEKLLKHNIIIHGELSFKENQHLKKVEIDATIKENFKLSGALIYGGVVSLVFNQNSVHAHTYTDYSGFTSCTGPSSHGLTHQFFSFTTNPTQGIYFHTSPTASC